jgi:uncharacterized protein with HEPN domain
MPASVSKKIRRPAMNKDDSIHLQHIVEAIEQINRYTRGMSESEFFSRTMVQDAVLRQIQVIAEAASCISIEFQSEHPKLQWSNMMSISKRIIPGNISVNLANVWNAIQDDLPLHKQAIKKLL